MVVMMLVAVVMSAVVMKRELVIAVASYWPGHFLYDAEPMPQVTSHVKVVDWSLGYELFHQNTKKNDKKYIKKNLLIKTEINFFVSTDQWINTTNNIYIPP